MATWGNRSVSTGEMEKGQRMAREIAKAYEPQRIEPRWAEFWVKEALFKADPNAPGPVFSMVIPPPNVTGSLHIGHMLNHTEIDVLTRWHRMRGYNTLYLPGMDHAGISTQRVVVRQLAEQGIDYRKLGREEFERRVWKWKEESGGTILRQMRQIGESCDWSRERFTLSPELSKVVREVFVRLYEEGLIYRATRLVNWCPDCLTVLSDLEVVFEARKKIVADLKAQGLLEKTDDHTNAIGLCERSKTVVEPRISTQWFCKMKDLAVPAIKAVEEYEPGKENCIHIVPDNRRTEYLNWMRNIRDWTLSRQLWWGHRIPAWYCGENKHVTVARETPAKA